MVFPRFFACPQHTPTFHPDAGSCGSTRVSRYNTKLPWITLAQDPNMYLHRTKSKNEKGLRSCSRCSDRNRHVQKRASSYAARRLMKLHLHQHGGYEMHTSGAGVALCMGVRKNAARPKRRRPTAAIAPNLTDTQTCRWTMQPRHPNGAGL